jgi:hypothetical protein
MNFLCKNDINKVSRDKGLKNTNKSGTNILTFINKNKTQNTHIKFEK